MKYLIEVEVDEDKLRRSRGIDVGEENEYEESIETLIIAEMGWVDDSGIYLTSVKEVESEVTGEYKIPETVEKLGIEISEIINQDGEDKTDGQCIDEIINLLDKYELYKKRI